MITKSYKAIVSTNEVVSSLINVYVAEKIRTTPNAVEMSKLNDNKESLKA